MKSKRLVAFCGLISALLFCAGPAYAVINCTAQTNPAMDSSPGTNLGYYDLNQSFNISGSCTSSTGKSIVYTVAAYDQPSDGLQPYPGIPDQSGTSLSFTPGRVGKVTLYFRGEETGCTGGQTCGTYNIFRYAYVFGAGFTVIGTEDVGETLTLHNYSQGYAPLTYTWELVSKPAGSNAALGSSAFLSDRSLVADIAGAYKIRLTAVDGSGHTMPFEKTLNIGAQPFVDAVADAPAQGTPGEAVALSASQSSGYPLPLSYSWSFYQKPAGSNAVIANPTSVNAGFLPDKVGIYIVELEVNNAGSLSDSTLKFINVTASQSISANAPPITTEKNEAGTSQITVTGAGEGDSITYGMSGSPAHGSASVSASGLVTYTPAEDYTGSDEVVTLVTVSGSVNQTVSVTIPVTIENTADPSASAPAIHITQGEVGHSQVQVLNAEPGDQKTFSISAAPEHGSATVSSLGLVDYTPNSDFSGSDEIGVSIVITGEKPANLSVTIPVEVEQAPVNPPNSGNLCPTYSRAGLKIRKNARKLDDAGQTCGSGSPISPKGTPTNTKCADQGCVVDPVNVATGAMWHEFQDFYVPGRTPQTSLSFQRMYVTQAAGPVGDLGPNWRHNWETQLLSVQDSEDLVWIDEVGGPWYFQKTAGDFTSPAGFSGKLSDQGDHYELKKQDLTVLFFAKNTGKLQKLREPHGEEVTLSYENGKLMSVSAPLAGTLNFSYNTSGRIVGVTRARDGLSYTFGYDENGRLNSFTDFANLHEEYTYVSDRPGTFAQGMMESLKDEIGRTTRFTYFDDGRMKEVVEAEGASGTFAYTEEPSTTVHDIDGTTTTFHFDPNYRVIETDYADGAHSFTEWSAGGYIKSITNELGKVFQYGYDPQGNMTKVQGPEDATPALANYNQVFNLPLSYSPQVGAGTEFTIDAQKGDILEIRRPGTSETLKLNFGVDSFGNILSVSNGRATYSHERNTDGLLTKVFDARNPETRSYDSRARLVTRSFASGRTIQYTYDDYDRITSAVDSHGPDLSFVYDGVGRVLSRTITDGVTNQITSFTWDAYDRITSIRNPKGEVTKFVYETSRVLDSPSSIIDPMGKTTQLAYDARGRLISTTDANGAVITYGYDLAGELISVTDANGNVTSYAYDGNGRKSSETRASVMGTSSGNEAVNSTTNYTYDAGGRLIKEEKVSASGGDNRVIEYQYDEFDRLARKVLKKGDEVQDDSVYSYESQLDATLLKTAANGVANLGFSHEALPPFAGTGFSQAAAEAGNPLGLLEKAFSTEPGITGEVAKIQDELGNVLFTKAYDPAGRLIGVKAGSFKTGISYDGFGRRMYLAHSDGSTQTIQYDLLNRIKALSWRTKNGPNEEHLNYDPSGNVFELSRENSRYDIEHDLVNRITAVKSEGLNGEDPYTRKFILDAMGSRIADSHANMLSKFVSNFLVRNGESSFTADLDGLGQVAQEITGGQVKNFAYRGDGKPSSFLSGNRTVTYFYDAIGRLVAQQVKDNGNLFMNSFLHLGMSNQILQVKAGDGAITTYIDGQGPNEHLGEVKSGVGKGYINDHMGSVLNSPAAGSSHSYGLFGEVYGNVPVSPSMSPVIYAWQGLRYDPLTGQYDNLARRYNQNTGTFTSQDPLGLASGEINLYSSRRNNPLIYTDPNGRNPLVIAGALIGAGVNAYQAYQAGGSIRQIVLSAGVGAISGGLAGLTGGLGLVGGAAGAFSAGYFNNAANQIIFTGDVDNSQALKAGVVSAGVGAIGYGVTSFSNRYVYEFFSEGAGFTTGTVLEMFNNGGIPNDPNGNKLNVCR